MFARGAIGDLLVVDWDDGEEESREGCRTARDDDDKQKKEDEERGGGGGRRGFELVFRPGGA